MDSTPAGSAMETGLGGLLAGHAGTLGLALSTDQQQQLLDYIRLLQKWNRAYNLTAIREPAEMLTRHLLDSLVVAPYLVGERFIDVGTGPGLPGIPLAIAQPGRHFTLLDGNGKKVRFLFQVITTLGLTNASEVHARVEDFYPEAAYDGVISRAFSALDTMVAGTGHLLKPGGRFYAMKGRYPEKELSRLPKTYTVTGSHRLEIPGVEGARHLIEIGVAP